MTVATLALAIGRSNFLARSHPLSATVDLVHSQLDLVYFQLDLVHFQLDLVHFQLDLVHS
jgi:hypothetical protein